MSIFLSRLVATGPPDYHTPRMTATATPATRLESFISRDDQRRAHFSNGVIRADDGTVALFHFLANQVADPFTDENINGLLDTDDSYKQAATAAALVAAVKGEIGLSAYPDRYLENFRASIGDPVGILPEDYLTGGLLDYLDSPEPVEMDLSHLDRNILPNFDLIIDTALNDFALRTGIVESDRSTNDDRASTRLGNILRNLQELNKRFEASEVPKLIERSLSKQDTRSEDYVSMSGDITFLPSNLINLVAQGAESDLNRDGKAFIVTHLAQDQYARANSIEEYCARIDEAGYAQPNGSALINDSGAADILDYLSKTNLSNGKPFEGLPKDSDFCSIGEVPVGKLSITGTGDLKFEKVFEIIGDQHNLTKLTYEALKRLDAIVLPDQVKKDKPPESIVAVSNILRNLNVVRRYQWNRLPIVNDMKAVKVRKDAFLRSPLHVLDKAELSHTSALKRRNEISSKLVAAEAVVAMHRVDLDEAEQSLTNAEISLQDAQRGAAAELA